MTDMQTETERKKILQLYMALAASLVLSFVPMLWSAIASIIVFTGVLIAAYVMRSGSEKDDLTNNHTSFIIRTIWIGSFLMMLTVAAGCAYMLQFIDNTPFSPCIDRFINMGSSGQIMDPQGLMRHFETCIDNFINVNLGTLVIAGFITAGPIVLYFIMRIIRGLKSASAGVPIANLKGWL